MNIRRFIHWLIVWYLRRCGGSFHAFPYGLNGKYVVLMNEVSYHNFKNGTNISDEAWNIYYYKDQMKELSNE